MTGWTPIELPPSNPKRTLDIVPKALEAQERFGRYMARGTALGLDREDEYQPPLQSEVARHRPRQWPGWPGPEPRHGRPRPRPPVNGLVWQPLAVAHSLACALCRRAMRNVCIASKSAGVMPW